MVRKILRHNLLDKLLKVLIDEWGYNSVRELLEALNTSNEAQSGEVAPSKQHRARKKSEKTTASALASKISLPPEQKRLIQILAERYDTKLFLPTAGDIRYFFEMHGEVPPPSKQRGDKFRQILNLLSTLQESTLQKIIEDEAHSGPAQLGPLSDAMRDAGKQRLGGRDSIPTQVYEQGEGVETDQSSNSPSEKSELEAEQKKQGTDHN